MAAGNLAVIITVVALVTCVLGIVYAAVYRLDKSVDPGTR